MEFEVACNPAGILFNPHSLAQFMQNALSGNADQELFVVRDEKHFSLGLHSKIHADSGEELDQRIHALLAGVNEKLRKGNLLILTFGTSWVYRHKKRNRVVANCHKLPQSDFEKEILTMDGMLDEYKLLLDQLFVENPNLKIVLTVSPVRHLKDGFVQNNQSKALLLLLCAELARTYKDRVSYFPAYELVLDDLRDYRFYKEDLIHPNNQAVDYVFNKLINAWCDKETIELIKLKEQILSIQNHRTILESGPEKSKFLQLVSQFEAGVGAIRSLHRS